MPETTSNNSLSTVSIRPGVAVLSVLSHLNYRPWFAVAEFVDNALQSFLTNRERLLRPGGRPAKLSVDILIDDMDGGRVVVRDNAAGIGEQDYERAFKPAAVPTDRTGLSEFGMGMKSAACWFGRRWSVRTTAIGESVERFVAFDVDLIVSEGTEEIAVTSRPVLPTYHYTEIKISGLHQKLSPVTVGKIKRHLASIYRVFLRRGILQIEFNTEALTYEEPEVLVAQPYRSQDGQAVTWRKEIDLDLGVGLRAHGFAGLRRVGSTRTAGFALFRRDRLIQGSADEGYRPDAVFGEPNSFTYQRLFGELYLEGFEVSHTKDGFRWDENEETFLELLREELDKEPLPLLDQAEGYRARARTDDLRAGAELAGRRTAEVIQKGVPEVLGRQIGSTPDPAPPAQDLPSASLATRRVIPVELDGQQWQIILELTDDPAIGDWLDLCEQPIPEGTPDCEPGCRVGVRLSLTHPFMERFGGADANRIEPLLRVAAAIALAETSARKSGVRYASSIRHHVNDLLLNALAAP
jgi:hypothetical protein